jgi:DNA-binding transcriptional regulator YiaG
MCPEYCVTYLSGRTRCRFSRPYEAEIRKIRLRLAVSQQQFAALLNVAAETYRAWDSGRRMVPTVWMDKARALQASHDPCQRMSLQELAGVLGVHVRTLRGAARSGRLDVTYANRVVFRNPVPRATLAAGQMFMSRYYKQSYSRFAPKPPALKRGTVPTDWASQLVSIRQQLELTQAQLAAQVGAANKAVIYQWESGKRRPSPVFWERIERLLACSCATAK